MNVFTGSQGVLAFFEQADRDRELAGKLKESNAPANILAVAAEYGYQFTERELLAVKQEQMAMAFGETEELSDRQLASIAGAGRRQKFATVKGGGTVAGGGGIPDIDDISWETVGCTAFQTPCPTTVTEWDCPDS